MSDVSGMMVLGWLSLVHFFANLCYFISKKKNFFLLFCVLCAQNIDWIRNAEFVSVRHVTSSELRNGLWTVKSESRALTIRQTEKSTNRRITVHWAGEWVAARTLKICLRIWTSSYLCFIKSMYYWNVLKTTILDVSRVHKVGNFIATCSFPNWIHESYV
jgi:hypothetical protein